MEIFLKTGINDINFGMSPSTVINLLGQPSSIKIDEDDDNRVVWQYNEFKLRLTFYKDYNDRLGYIRSANTNLSYKGRKIINSEINLAKDEIFVDLGKNWEIDEYEFFISHFNEENWLILNEEYGLVSDLEFGVPFKNELEYNWPS